MCENGANCNHAAAHREYDKALRRAFWAEVDTQVRRKCNDLIPLNQVLRRVPATDYQIVGTDNVDLNAIVGSSGRYRDFNLRFLPRRREPDERWVNIAQAHYDGVLLPPVRLYKVGDMYYVDDGNHRVSVARVLGHESITASIVEINSESLISDPACQRTGYQI